MLWRRDVLAPLTQRPKALLPGKNGCGQGCVCSPASVNLSTLGRVQRAKHVLGGQSVNVILFSHGDHIPGRAITL